MEKLRSISTPGYKWIFNTENGLFVRWGKNATEDPNFSPLGPEIVDMEISTICHHACKHCYKSNIPNGQNMSFQTFKAVLEKIPKNVTQIAFGIGDIDGNPDLWKILNHTREQGIVPNITINGFRMKPEYYQNLANLCGAVSVSLYNKESCYNAVNNLLEAGLKQVNIHCLLSEETCVSCLMTVLDYNSRKLQGLNAIVFLWVKPKGRGIGYHEIDEETFRALILPALDRKIPIGFDSCSAPMFCEITENKYSKVAESCESGLFSAYINHKGNFFPCSFAEGNGEWDKGLNVLNCEDFLANIWFNPLTEKYRNQLIQSKDKNGCRHCFLYNLGETKNVYCGKY